MAAINGAKVVQGRPTVHSDGGGCFGCCKTSNSISVPITIHPPPRKEGWCSSITSNYKKYTAALSAGMTVGAGLMLAIVGSGSSTAAAMAGFASGSMSTSGESDLSGSGNVQAGSGGSSLLSFNSISMSKQVDTGVGTEGDETRTAQLTCMQQGMTYVNPTDGAVLSWDSVTGLVKCKTDFVGGENGTRSEMLKGICTHAHIPSATTTRNRRDLSALDPVATASTTVLAADPYSGRVGNQMEWPLTEEDYSAFNLALLTGAVLLVNGVRYWFVGPVCTGVRNYLSSDG